MVNKVTVSKQFIIGLILTVLLIFYSAALFASKYWFSAIVTAVAAGLSNPGIPFNKAWLRWTIVVVLLLSGILQLPDT